MIKLEKGIYVNKDKIEEYFKNLKAKVLVKKILVVDGIGQKK